MSTTKEEKAMKRCYKCEQTKPVEEFYKSRHSRDGRKFACKGCCRVQQQSPAGRESMSKTNRKRNFGMSDMEFNRRCDLQGWTCAICKGVDLDKRPSKYPGRAQSLRVDHCHRHTGPMVKVRGLLCHRCNTGLGSFRDSLGLLRAAQQYLLDHG